jgi:DNA-binding response OmpR family regulator
MNAAGKKLAVLVEDNPSLQKLTSLYLERLGFAVEVVGDGAAALERIASVKPDLVCLDLMLPRVSGYDVCEQLRRQEEFKRLPILILSARTTPEDRAHAEDVGANAFLAKPYKEQQFVAVVTKLMTS